jgi:hypothetical protein
MNTIINISLSPTITNQKYTRGGITGRHFHPWKPQFLAPVSKNCFLKGWKTCSKSSWFLENHVFTLTCSLAFAVAWQSFSARSLCCERHCHCHTLATKSLLILPLFLVWMPRGILSLLFFYVQSIPPVCAHKAGFGPRSKFKRRSC